jgi:hypothetical protein
LVGTTGVDVCIVEPGQDEAAAVCERRGCGRGVATLQGERGHLKDLTRLNRCCQQVSTMSAALAGHGGEGSTDQATMEELLTVSLVLLPTYRALIIPSRSRRTSRTASLWARVCLNSALSMTYQVATTRRGWCVKCCTSCCVGGSSSISTNDVCCVASSRNAVACMHGVLWFEEHKCLWQPA